MHTVLRDLSQYVYGSKHVDSSVLKQLDSVQNRLLRELRLTEKQALLQHNLAPLPLRRDIAMLGMLFKCVRGDAHPGFRKFIREARHTPHRFNTRTASARHAWQLEDPTTEYTLDCVRRSLLGLVRVYNLLPTDCVEAASVSKFQIALTALAKKLCQDDCCEWVSRFSPLASHSVLLLV